MILYKTGDRIYFEDSANNIDGEWWPWTKAQFKKVSSTVLFIRLYKYGGKDFKKFVSGEYTATDIDDENGASYGSTPEDVINGLVKTIDVSNVDIIFDTITGAQEVISSPLTHIHEANAYTASVQNEGGTGTKATITFKTPNTSVRMYMILHARCNVEAHYTLGEAPTITGGSGTNFIVFNRERNSVKTSAMIATATATAGELTEGAIVTNLGLGIELRHFGSGKAGGANRGDDEWILKQNTVYVLEAESEAASSDVTVEMEWYELNSN